jgi:hypothetical protein
MAMRVIFALPPRSSLHLDLWSFISLREQIAASVDLPGWLSCCFDAKAFPQPEARLVSLHPSPFALPSVQPPPFRDASADYVRFLL